MTLQEKAKKLPLSSGVYLFLNKDKTILYVGRAVSLRKRVVNYFQKGLDSRIQEMVSSASFLKFIKTDTFLEAVILEANLIKKHWPKYNIREKDNRSFIYIVIPKTPWPKPFIIRRKEMVFDVKKHSYIFGPYQSQTLVENALKIARRIFPYSTCRPNSGKPCFDYQIGLCPGSCISLLTKEEYQKNIDNLVLFLKGEKKKLLKKLKKENPEKIKALQHIQDVSLLSKSDFSLPFFRTVNRIEGYDVSHLSGKETFGSMVSFLNGKPNKNYYRLFKIKDAPANDDLRSLEEMIVRRFRHLEWPFPDLILIDGGKPQIDFVYKRIKPDIMVVGISKFSKDKLVFPKNTKQAVKDLVTTMRETLLQVRDEAHRFALSSSRRKRRIK